MQTASIKIGVWVLLVLGAWELLQTEAVSRALLLFCAAGVIPGTNQTLSPNATLWVMAGTLVVSVVAIFHRELWRGVRRIFALRPNVAMVADAPIAAPAVHASMPAGAPPQPRPVVVITLPGRPGYLTRAARFVWPHIRRGAERLVRASQQTLMLASIYTAHRAVQFWHWLEPRLRRFDRWLELKFKELRWGRAAVQAAGDIAARSRTIRSGLHAAYAKILQR